MRSGLSGDGWEVGFADEHGPGGETRLEWDRRTLVVVDDADLQVPLLADLLPHLAYQTGAPPVRLLLVAREPGRWWEDLNAQTNDLARGLAAPARSLQTGRLDPAERIEQRDAALAAFASRLSTPRSAVVLPDLTNPAFANPLLVHMRALVALLEEGDTEEEEEVGELGEQPIGARAWVLRGMLNRERQRWRRLAPADLGETVQLQAVTLATLTAANRRDHLVELLRAVPDLTDTPTERRGAVADWLHALYPGSTPGGVAPLRPDLLAEQLLADTPQLVELVLDLHPRATDIGQVTRLLAELLRAANAEPQAFQAIDQLLATRLAQLLQQALVVPTTPLPRLLADALRLAPQPAQAAELVDELPRHSTATAGLAAVLTTQTVDHYRALVEAAPDAYLPNLAGSLNNLAVRLAEVGRRQEALAPIEEAVAIRRRLAEVGRRQEALAPIEEAVHVYRALAEAAPDAYLPDLAMSLNNLGAWLSKVGRREGAELARTAAQEAVDIYRTLADRDGGNRAAFLPRLAVASSNLAAAFQARYRGTGSARDLDQAVDLLHAALEVTPPDHPDRAAMLSNLAALAPLMDP